MSFPALESVFFFCQKMTWCLRMEWGRTLLHSSPYSDNSSAITSQGCIKMKLAAAWEIPSPPTFPTYSLRRLNRWWVEEFDRAALWRNTEGLFQCAHSPSVCDHLPRKVSLHLLSSKQSTEAGACWVQAETEADLYRPRRSSSASAPITLSWCGWRSCPWMFHCNNYSKGFSTVFILKSFLFFLCVFLCVSVSEMSH